VRSSDRTAALRRARPPPAEADSPPRSPGAPEPSQHDRGPGQSAQLSRIRSHDPQWQGRQAVCDHGGVDQPDKRLLVVYEFSTRFKRCTGRTFRYAKDSSDFVDNNATNIFVTGDMTHVAANRYIMIERDDFQRPLTSANPPRQKKLYLFDLNQVERKTGVLKSAFSSTC
jgi:hypothetical protein